MKLFTSIMLVSVCAFFAHGQPVPFPDIDAARSNASKIKAFVLAYQATNVPVIQTNPPAQLFTNQHTVKFSTNAGDLTNTAWLGLLEYTDDGGANWHHIPTGLLSSNFTPSNMVFTFTNSARSRLFMFTITEVTMKVTTNTVTNSTSSK